MGWVHGGAGATGRTTGESACPSQHCTDHPRGVPSGGGRDGPWADSVVAGGGRGWMLCWTGVLASHRVVWVLRARVVQFLQSLAGRCVEVGGGCRGIPVKLWSVGIGWLLVHGACWHGLRVGGLPMVVGCSL